MSSSYRIKRRIDSVTERGNQAYDFGPWYNHYIEPSASKECNPNYYGIPIGNQDGVKVCVRRVSGSPDYIVENQKKINNQDLTGYYKTFGLYDYTQKEQTRVYNTWPPGYWPNNEDSITKDYIRLPIRFNGTGLTDMKRKVRQNIPYGWDVVRDQPSDRYDKTKSFSSPYKGDLRNRLWAKYHGGKGVNGIYAS